MKMNKKITITDQERNILMSALDCLIDRQGDTEDYTDLINKLIWKTK